MSLDAAKMDQLIIGRKYVELEEFINLLNSRNYQSSKCRAENYYIIGNGYAVLADGFDSFWDERVGLQVKFYKKSQYEHGFSELSDDLRSKVYTNLANALHSQGRLFEALKEYDTAIAIFNNPIAYFSKGRLLVEVSSSLYDGDHAMHFQKEAYPILKYIYECKETLFDADHLKFIEAATPYVEFVSHFNQHFDSISEEFPHLSKFKGSMGKSGKERSYKKWCLENTLFINDLNEITTEPVAAQDVMGLPSVRYSINPLVGVTESLWLGGGFSEIKHQYAHARFTYYEAIESQYAQREVSHYANNDLFLVNSLDYCIYRRDIEQIKISFRLLYSCFDKLAVLLFKYLHPGSVARVYFSNVWYGEKKKVKQNFLDSDNPYLLALHWLSREINDDETEGHDHWMDSNAGKLADIRNKLEHGGFRVVVDDLYKVTNPFEKSLAKTKHAETLARIEKNNKILKSGIPKAEQQHIREKINSDQRLIDERDDLQGYPLIITDKELRNQTLRLMRKVRYAIMYTSLAIHYEEEKSDDSSIVIPYETPMYKN
ncbi:LA2681 family HEPN domain-containing protein [Pseudomonas sp. MWU13-2105]|uniref:LA2681 family HEPN domain-containing protein n=1 Tax=Pseudomonas sp. MWU13-2105 TaxID=2935074 RepID=UPI00200E59AB|nr:LA2681 family HEPN domain-containing protein [Pseudomonas sp. MWU13-2105]